MFTQGVFKLYKTSEFVWPLRNAVELLRTPRIVVSFSDVSCFRHATYVAFNAPHTPIQAEESDIELFKNIDNDYDRKYAANIFSLDREIGKIIKAIENSGLLEETIIVFFSDNGPVFDVDPIAKVIAPDLLSARGSAGKLKGSKLSAYEGGIRVPAVIYWKGKLEGGKSEQFFFAHPFR